MTGASIAAAQMLRERAAEPLELAVLLDEGLGSVAEMLEQPQSIPYRELAGFPGSAAPAPEGQVVIGSLEGIRAAFLQGSAHSRKSGSAGAMASALETMALLGVWTLLIATTAGSVRPGIYPGNIAAISDHINLTGEVYRSAYPGY